MISEVLAETLLTTPPVEDGRSFIPFSAEEMLLLQPLLPPAYDEETLVKNLPITPPAGDERCFVSSLAGDIILTQRRLSPPPAYDEETLVKNLPITPPVGDERCFVSSLAGDIILPQRRLSPPLAYDVESPLSEIEAPLSTEPPFLRIEEVANYAKTGIELIIELGTIFFEGIIKVLCVGGDRIV